MDPLSDLLGESPGIRALREQIGRLLGRHAQARRLPPVLLEGETGTGKGLLARLLHRASPRGAGPFVDVNCAAIPETLLEAELFGYERGAFTDARQAKPGLFQAAHRGTLFLDEVGLLPLGLQGKLLTVLEERVVRRLGSTRNEPVDVWILAATNADLAGPAREGRFREDLYHRLAVVTFTLPPLRARGADVLLLAERLLARVCADYRLPPKTLAPDARAALLAHPWRGNIRELGNVIERVALLSDTAVVTADLLDLTAPVTAEPGARPAPVAPLDDTVRAHLEEALGRMGWNLSRTAALLGIARNTLRARIARYGLRPPTAAPRRRRAAPAGPAVSVPTPSAALPTEPALPTRWAPRRLAFLRAAARALSGGSAVARVLEVLDEKVRSFGGTVEESSPTGLVATFGLEPVEDAPRRAAHAAMAVERALRAPGGASSGVRLAIHVARLLVGEARGRPQIALEGKRQAWADLEQLVASALPDGILVSEAAQPFVERRFELEPLGPLPGTDRRVYRLGASLPPGLERRLAPFVGRQPDLDQLMSRLVTARRGHGQVVGIVGEAGIGKSRLLHEFRQRVVADGITYRSGACRSYGSAMPYLPILDIVRENCGLLEGDGPETMTAKIQAALAPLAIDPARGVPLLLQLLGVREGTEPLAGVDPEAIQRETLALLQEMALRGSQRQPIVFAIEDLQWIDRTSEACLAALVDRLAAASVLLVSTYRPGYRPPWMERSYATQIALEPLGPDESRRLVEAVLPGGRAPAAVVTTICDRAEGNPFFLEELVRAVGEASPGALPLTVPETVEAVLGARIARLPDAARRLLQLAAVLGREVPARLLGALGTDAETLRPALETLVRQEFLDERPGRAGADYAFRHVLTQEVAYESLAPAERATLHAAAGRALEALHPDRPEGVCELLAHHYAHAGVTDRAFAYLVQAAEKAARRHAHTEAVAALRRALGDVAARRVDVPDRIRVDLTVRLASSLTALGQFAEVLDLLGPGTPGLEALDEPALAARYQFLLGRTYSFLGEHERAATGAQRAIDAARRGQDTVTLGRAYTLLALEAPLAGRAQEGIAHGREAVTLLEGTPERSWLGQAHWVLGLNHASMGEFERALAAHAEAAALGEAIGDRRLQTFATWATGMIHAAMGEGATGVAACRRALELAPDPLNTAIARGWLGYAHLEGEEPGLAIPLLEQAARDLGEFRFGQFHGWFTVFLAEAHRLTGAIERAGPLATEGLAGMAAARFVYGIGWATRALGRLAHARAAWGEAERHFSDALGTFAAIGARYEEARTHLDLAALARARGERAEAREHLEEARARFQALRITRYVERTQGLVQTLP